MDFFIHPSNQTIPNWINAEPAILQYNNIHKYENTIISNGWYNKHVIIFIFSVYFCHVPLLFWLLCSFFLPFYHIRSVIFFVVERKFNIWNVPRVCAMCASCVYLLFLYTHNKHSTAKKKIKPKQWTGWEKNQNQIK